MRAIAWSAALLLGLTVCGAQAGTPRPEQSATPGSTVEPSSASVAPSGSADGKLAGVEPCSLIADAEAAGIGLAAPGESDEIVGSPACRWKQSGVYGVAVVLDTDLGVDDLNHQGRTATPVSLAKHQGSKLPDPATSTQDSGSCSGYIAVSASSSVSIALSNSGSRGTELACRRVERVMKFVDAGLP